MSSKSRNQKRTKLWNLFRLAERKKKISEQKNWCEENYGKTVKHSDREYFITRDGSYRRITDKCDVVRNSKHYNTTVE